MNRKGDIPVSMLAVIAIGLAVYLGLTFSVLYNGFGKISSDYSNVISKIELNENYIRSISENAAKSAISNVNMGEDTRTLFMKEVEKSYSPKLEGMGNYFGKIRNGEFTFEQKEDRYYLEINGVFVQSEYKNSKITRNFNITLITP